MSKAEDSYALLGVMVGADAKALKKAFHKLAKQYHPDHNPGDKAAEEKFKKITEAYDFLSDPANRIEAAPAQPFGKKEQPWNSYTSPKDSKKKRQAEPVDEWWKADEWADDELYKRSQKNAGNHTVEFWGVEFILVILALLAFLVYLNPPYSRITVVTPSSKSSVYVPNR